MLEGRKENSHVGEENEGRDEDRRARNDEIWIAGLSEKRQVRSTRGQEEEEQRKTQWQKRCGVGGKERKRKGRRGAAGGNGWMDERRQDMSGKGVVYRSDVGDMRRDGEKGVQWEVEERRVRETGQLI